MDVSVFTCTQIRIPSRSIVHLGELLWAVVDLKPVDVHACFGEASVFIVETGHGDMSPLVKLERIGERKVAIVVLAEVNEGLILWV